MYSCPVPVIARIHGDCYAGGLGLAAVCDIRVVADTVTFSLSEARLGLLPATISPYVVRAMGEQAARRYFVTAERFGAAEAKAMGFAHEVTAADTIDAKVEELVAALVANGPMATRACKKLVQDVAGREITPELRAETARRIADIRASAEGKEGVSSFLEKRFDYAYCDGIARYGQRGEFPDEEYTRFDCTIELDDGSTCYDVRELAVKGSRPGYFRLQMAKAQPKMWCS